MPFQYEKLYSATDGYSLVTTLDETLQHYLEKQLEAALTEHNAKAVSGIVMNPKTGEILAMASKSDFDPNDPYTILDERLKMCIRDSLRTARLSAHCPETSAVLKGGKFHFHRFLQKTYTEMR